MCVFSFSFSFSFLSLSLLANMSFSYYASIIEGRHSFISPSYPTTFCSHTHIHTFTYSHPHARPYTHTSTHAHTHFGAPTVNSLNFVLILSLSSSPSSQLTIPPSSLPLLLLLPPSLPLLLASEHVKQVGPWHGRLNHSNYTDRGP